MFTISLRLLHKKPMHWLQLNGMYRINFTKSLRTTSDFAIISSEPYTAHSYQFTTNIDHGT